MSDELILYTTAEECKNIVPEDNAITSNYETTMDGAEFQIVMMMVDIKEHKFKNIEDMMTFKLKYDTYPIEVLRKDNDANR